MATKYAFRRATAGMFELPEPSDTSGKRFSSLRSGQRQLLSNAPADVRREIEQKVLEIRAMEIMEMPEEGLQGFAISAVLEWVWRRRVSRRSR